MSERKSSRRKKYEKPEKEKKAKESPSSDTIAEEKRISYPTQTVSILWDYSNLKRKLSEEQKEEIVQYYYEIPKKPSAHINNLTQRIEEYPDVPVYYDYLLLCYLLEENYDSAKQISEQMYKKFSSSLFGKVGFIEFQLLQENLEAIEESLQGKIHYKETFPEKGVFHVVEVLHYWFAIGKYLALSGNSEKAELCMKEIKSIDENSIFLKELQAVIDKATGVKFYQKIWRKLKRK